MEQRRVDRDRAWSNFWRHGALHSLQGSFAGNYAGEIRHFWNTVFRDVDGTQRVLDLCTGNGAIPAMLCERPESRVPRIDAVDRATPMPTWLDAAPAYCRRAVTFHAGVDAAELPFPTSSLDMAVSQYGIEYTHLPRTLSEMGRVLRDNATIALICHHADSHIARIATDEVASGRLLLSDGGLIAATAKLLPYLELAARGQAAQLSGNSTANGARHAFNSAISGVESAIRLNAFPDLLIESRTAIGTLVDEVVRGRRSAVASVEIIRTLGEAVEEGVFRQEELLTHALDLAGITRVSEILQSLGFEGPTIGFVRQDGRLLGWTLLTQRSGP